MGQNLAFLPLLLVLLLAFLVPPLLARIRWIPVVVGEILAGIVIGHSGFHLVRDDVTLDFLAEIGLALLMFLAGLEIDFSLLSQRSRTRTQRYMPALLASIVFILTLTLAGLLSFFLVRKGFARDPWMLTFILSTTSLGVVVPVLKERGMSAGLFGQTLILAALIADFFTMLLITIYVAVRSHGLSLELLVVGTLFVMALLVYRIGLVRIRKLRLQKVVEDIRQASTQVKVHGAIALMLAFVILAKFVGSEMILGAFLAGAVLSLLSQPADDSTRQKLEAIGFGFFIPLFFISVGIDFDFPSLLKNRATWLLTPILLAAAFGLKLLPSMIFRIALPWRRALAAGILLSARLSLIIAASGIGLRIGAINEATNAAFILIAAITSTVAPLLFYALLPEKREKGRLAIGIFGRNDIGLQVASELEQKGELVVFLDSPLFLADPRDLKPLRAEAAVAEASQKARMDLSVESWEKSRRISSPAIRSLLALDLDDDRNLDVCQEAASIGLDHIIALINDPSRLPEFQKLGVQTFTPARYQPTLLALMARNPDLFQILTSTREEHQIQEIELTDIPAAGRSIQEIRFGADILLLSVRRGHELIIPHGQTKLKPGDHLTVFGTAAALKDFMERLSE
jgi:Kef-type K+ transport system membrane component KefB